MDSPFPTLLPGSLVAMLRVFSLASKELLCLVVG